MESIDVSLAVSSVSVMALMVLNFDFLPCGGFV